MTVVFHADPDAFLAAAQAVALRSPASESLLTIWCENLKRRPPPANVALLCATARVEGTSAIALQVGPNPVVVARSDALAVAAIADALVAGGRVVPGVHGAEDACVAFAAQWCMATGRQVRVHARLRNHALARVAPVPDAPGRMREATPADLEWLIDASDRFVAEVRVPPAPEGTRAMIEGRLADGRYRIWEDGGEAVAFLGATSPVPRFGRIGPVWTPPDRRGRGYATSLVAQASAEMLARGVERIFLLTDLANPTSNAIYARIGYEPLDDEIELEFVD